MLTVLQTTPSPVLEFAERYGLIIAAAAFLVSVLAFLQSWSARRTDWALKGVEVAAEVSIRAKHCEELSNRLRSLVNSAFAADGTTDAAFRDSHLAEVDHRQERAARVAQMIALEKASLLSGWLGPFSSRQRMFTLTTLLHEIKADEDALLALA